MRIRHRAPSVTSYYHEHQFLPTLFPKIKLSNSFNPKATKPQIVFFPKKSATAPTLQLNFSPRRQSSGVATPRHLSTAYSRNFAHVPELTPVYHFTLILRRLPSNSDRHLTREKFITTAVPRRVTIS